MTLNIGHLEHCSLHQLGRHDSKIHSSVGDTHIKEASFQYLRTVVSLSKRARICCEDWGLAAPAAALPLASCCFCCCVCRLCWRLWTTGCSIELSDARLLASGKAETSSATASMICKNDSHGLETSGSLERLANPTFGPLEAGNHIHNL